MLQNGYVVWSGASLIDGSPIVLILTGFVLPSSNRRTGRQIQSWILQQEFVPTEAAKKGLDSGTCGDCALKMTNLGTCYVNMLPINNVYRKTYT
ncbi:MAG: hypothetical protein HC908_17255, partial [Calothrix sp. SM1_7_51]|nr:hypothetical protein [Calothrix sp. SM1_7_51]